MNVYPVTDAEVSTIGMMNVVSSTCFALGGIFVGLTLNVWINAAFASSLPPEARLLVHYGVPVCIAVAGTLFLSGFAAYFYRGRIWKRVKQTVTAQVRANDDITIY
jgi:hypothetical protein